MEGLRRSAWLVAAAALAPLLLFLVFQAGFQAREQRRVIEAQALSKSQSISIAADGEVRRIQSELDALATAQSLRAGDIDGFRDRATELGQLFAGWRGIELVDRDTGKVLLTIGAAGRTFKRVESSPAGVTGRLAGFVRGPGCPCLLFDRVAHGPSGERWDVHAIVATARLNALLPPAKGHYEVSALVGPYGRFIARSLNNDERFGNLGSTYLRRVVFSGKSSGIYRGRTLEGFENYTAFARSPETGWSAHVALGASYIDNPARRFLASVGVAALLAFALAAILVWFALRQVAEGRRLANRMQQSQKLEALGQLTGGIAHDFNNLLTPIVGALDFLAGHSTLDARGKRLAAGALASADRASKLTAQLLAFSRRQKLQIEPLDIGAMLDDISGLVRQSVGDGHSLEILQDDPTLCAFGDVNQLELAMLNLTINARDASPAGGTIRIAVTGEGAAEDGRVMIAVSDQGVGMDEETRLRAFEPFFTTKSQGGGTGLGLAQVFGMVQQSGGTIAIDSAPDEGTTVTLSLRRCPAAERRQSLSERPAASGETPLLRLLVVDDDPEVRGAIVRPLEEAGHIVDAVSDGPTALAAIAQRAFDVVLVDFAMPGMDGAEVIRRAGDIRPDGRFLIVSGYADSEAIAAASPDTPVLKKPFASGELVALVRALAG